MGSPIRFLRCTGVAVLLLAAMVSAPHGHIVRAAVTVTVTTALDTMNPCAGTGGGTCSLRDAIAFANLFGNAGSTIAFSIPGAGVRTMMLDATLPTLRLTQQGVTIDATTQPGYTGSPLIELRGSGEPPGAFGLWLSGAGGDTVKGLAIYGFTGTGAAPGSGILIDSNGNTVQGNVIGMPAAGVGPVLHQNGNFNGVTIIGGSGNTIGGTTAAARNIISGNGYAGVFVVNVPPSSGNVIAGNYIGTDKTGTASVCNLFGVYIQNASNNVVGGTVAGAGNLISANPADGVVIDGHKQTDALNAPTGTAGGNVVQGNLIGSDVTGSAVLSTAMCPNNISNYHGQDEGVYILDASGNLIGGTTAAARNVIVGSDQNGITIDGSGDAPADAMGNVVQGNYLGINAAGTAALPNRIGVYIGAARNNTIGGAAPGTGNVIYGTPLSGNGTTSGGGVFIDAHESVSESATVPGGYKEASGNVVQGNRIGTNPAGTAAIDRTPQYLGITIAEGKNNTIAGNVIANSVVGILINGVLAPDDIVGGVPRDATGNVIQGNFIGTGANGAGVIPNNTGIEILSATHNTIGGTTAGTGNTIANNTGYGVYIATNRTDIIPNPPANRDAILGNAIYNNGAAGIALDPGANNNQAAPVLTSATTTTVSGSVAGTAGTTYRVELFSNPAGTAQGKIFITAASVAPNSPFAIPVTGVSLGQYITTTATNLTTFDTSIFSASVTVTPPPPSPVALPRPPASVTPGQPTPNPLPPGR